MQGTFDRYEDFSKEEWRIEYRKAIKWNLDGSWVPTKNGKIARVREYEDHSCGTMLKDFLLKTGPFEKLNIVRSRSKIKKIY